MVCKVLAHGKDSANGRQVASLAEPELEFISSHSLFIIQKYLFYYPL